MPLKQHLLSFTIVAGLVGCEEKENTVNNGPILNAVTITPSDDVITSSDLRCDTTASDPDNDPLNLTFQWTNQDGVLLGETRELQLTPSTTRPLDTITCTAIVTDGEDSVQGTSLITVDNQAPFIESISIEPNTTKLGEAIQCLMTVTDPDLETATTSITWEQNGTDVSSDPTLILREDTFQKGDAITCNGTATDAYDGTDTETATIEIQNTPPAFDSLSITPALPTTQDTIECTPGGTFDIDGDELSFAYRWFVNGTEHNNGESSISSALFVGQTIQCEVTISDDEEDGNTLTAETTIQNTPPSIDTISLSPSILEADTFVECLSTVSDIDNQSTTLTHQWTVGSTIVGTESTLQLSPTIVEPEDIIDCTITATDESGASTSNVVSTTIMNTSPYWNAVVSITGTSLQGDTLTCTGEALDINDGTLSNQYEWMLSDGTILSSDATWVVDTSIAPPGETIGCTVTATDSDGASISDSTNTTVQNTLPTVVASLTPTMVYTDTTIEIIPQYSDADTTQTVTGTIEWHVVDSLTGSDNIVQTGPTTTLDGSHYNKGDLVYATIIPNDGIEDGVSVTTSSIEVLNSTPYWNTSPTISGTPASNNTIVCEGEALDLDDGTASNQYAWTLTDGTVLSNTADLLVDTSVATPGETVECTITAMDSDGASISDSTSIIVQNTLPTVVATLTPTMVYTDSTIEVLTQYSDLDSTQTVTGSIEWHVVDISTGVDNIVQTGSTTTLDGSHFNKAAMVYAIVTPNDGIEDGSSETTNSIEVLNTLPSTPDISLTPISPNIDADDIVCQIDSPSVDVDSDTIEYAFEWTLSDGSLIQSTLSQTLSDTLSSGTLLAPDTVSCTVTPQDNEGVGSSTTDIVTGLYDCNCPTIGTQDYAYTYWPTNFRHANFNLYGFYTERHFLTGYYGMTMDMTTGSLLTLGQQTNPTSLSNASLSTDDWLTTSLGAEVYYGVEINGSYVEATDFSNPDESGTHAANNPSQLMDMGRFIQHIEIPELLYTGNTDLTGSLGIVSAPQHFVLTHRMTSSTSYSGSISIIVELAGDLFTQIQNIQYIDGNRAVQITDSDGSDWIVIAPESTDSIEQLSSGSLVVSRTVSALNAGNELTLPVLIAPADTMSSEQMSLYLDPDNTADVTYAQMNQTDTLTTNIQTALWNPEFGCFEVNLGNMTGSGASHTTTTWQNETDFNIYNRHQVTVTHASSSDLHIPLFFDGPRNTTFNITGGSPLFRSADEEPTGIPIQVSKNWHIPGYWPNWFHMYSTPTFPAGTHPFELTIAVGKWGETFAASHAQLSLVGWGTNQQWDESALGAWGESITYDPDKTLRRAMVDDVRPFLMNVNGEYNWTGNVGGADFLKYVDINRTWRDQQPTQLKSTYTAPGPVMTDVTYTGITNDDTIALTAQTHLVRTDDLVRAYYVLQYDFLEDIEYARLGLFQIAADNYSDNGFTKYAYGDSTGVLFDGTVPNHNTTGYASNADRGIELTGDYPWVFMYDSTKTGDSLPEHVADVGFVVREYSATINGTTITNPHININRTRNGGWSQMAFELGVPFDPNDTVVEAGSSITAIVEYIVVPNDISLYYGSSTDLLGVNSALFGTTDIIELLAMENDVAVNAIVGSVLQEQPAIISGFNAEIAAEFELVGGFGYTPITISGLYRADGWILEENQNGSWVLVDQSVHGNDYWQTAFDETTSTYALTFSVNTDAPTTFRLRR